MFLVPTQWPDRYDIHRLLGWVGLGMVMPSLYQAAKWRFLSKNNRVGRHRAGLALRSRRKE